MSCGDSERDVQCRPRSERAPCPLFFFYSKYCIASESPMPKTQSRAEDIRVALPKRRLALPPPQRWPCCGSAFPNPQTHSTSDDIDSDGMRYAARPRIAVSVPRVPHLLGSSEKTGMPRYQSILARLPSALPSAVVIERRLIG